ncbi:hypothetical protein NDU88_002871 [Pleurodeles waltl]|uniref:Uncharacterized protein n=1 Tax=Pleurodeles waltl TaxID=8319 RepID=A0AAV7TLX7_PLEWA|nr:hypothetical protein NDU88_002871 [Pleurodeles waltl]
MGIGGRGVQETPPVTVDPWDCITYCTTKHATMGKTSKKKDPDHMSSFLEDAEESMMTIRKRSPAQTNAANEVDATKSSRRSRRPTGRRNNTGYM